MLCTKQITLQVVTFVSVVAVTLYDASVNRWWVRTWTCLYNYTQNLAPCHLTSFMTSCFDWWVHQLQFLSLVFKFRFKSIKNRKWGNLFDIRMSNNGAAFLGHAGKVTCLEMAHYSLLLWSSSLDGTVRKWDISSGSPGLLLRYAWLYSSVCLRYFWRSQNVFVTTRWWWMRRLNKNLIHTDQYKLCQSCW
jgi:WD40 repeat protein